MAQSPKRLTACELSGVLQMRNALVILEDVLARVKEVSQKCSQARSAMVVHRLPSHIAVGARPRPFRSFAFNRSLGG